MNGLRQVRVEVEKLYAQKNPNRDEWADWLYDNHVLIVARNARELAKKYGANQDLSEVAALLHDVADTTMARVNPTHEESSLMIARQIMAAAGFTADEILLVVDDAIRYHSCRGNERPTSKEGLVLATADSLAHFQTDFYVYASWAFGKTRSLKQLKGWALKKLDKDFNNKIAYHDEREAVRTDYNNLKKLFSC